MAKCVLLHNSRRGMQTWTAVYLHIIDAEEVKRKDSKVENQRRDFGTDLRAGDTQNTWHTATNNDRSISGADVVLLQKRFDVEIPILAFMTV